MASDAGMPTPFLSVVMPTYENPDCLALTLRSLSRQTLSRHEYEVVIIRDGGDTPYDAVAELAADWNFRFESLTAHRGRSAARNRGIELARGEVIVFLDSDSYAAPDLLERHLNFHRAGVGGPPRIMLGKRYEIDWPDTHHLLEGDPPGPQAITAGAGDQRFPHWYGEAEIALLMETPWLYAFTHNLSARREVLLLAGAFDEALSTRWGYEDTDLFYRVYMMLGQPADAFVYDAMAICYHLPQYRDTGSWQYESAANNEIVRAKHLTYEWELFSLERFADAPWQLRRYRKALALCRSTANCRVAPVWPRLRRLLTPARVGRGLLIGMGTEAVRLPPGTATCDHTRPLGGGNTHLLGVRTPFPDRHFDVVVNIDLWRYLRLFDLLAYLNETLRIAGSTVLVYSSGLVPAPDVPCADDLGYVLQMLAPHFAMTTQTGENAEDAVFIQLARHEPGYGRIREPVIAAVGEAADGG
jgi:glycosyltransferase involved in cell wall biosynthesis